MIQIPVEPQITDFLHKKASKYGIPLNGTFELTPLCNMDCRMCYIKMSTKQQKAIAPLRSAQEWIHLGKSAKEQGMLYLLLTGGEPFMRTDMQEILRGLHKLGLVISINSNATLIDEKVIDWLKETPPIRINITMYGASDTTYEKLCRNPKGFTQVTRAIELLRNAGISVKINCSVTPYNAKDLDKIFEYCKSEGLIVQATSYMFPPLRKNVEMIGINDRFTPEDAAYYAARIAMLYNGKDAFLKQMIEKKRNKIPDIPEEDCLEIEGEGIRCRAGKSCFWITWNGQFLPCGMLTDKNSLNVFEVGFEEAWRDVRKRVSEICMPAKCTVCELKDECKVCAAMVYTENGSFLKEPEYRCRMTQAYYHQCKRLEEEIRGQKIK